MFELDKHKGNSGNIYQASRTPQVCNSQALEFVASGWTDSLNGGLINPEGGYSLDVRLPAVLIQDGAKFVGALLYTVMVNSQQDTYIWIDFTYVDVSYRQDSIFKAMLKELEYIATEEEAKYIELGTHRDNHVMQKACNKHEFFPESITLRKSL